MGEERQTKIKITGEGFANSDGSITTTIQFGGLVSDRTGSAEDQSGSAFFTPPDPHQVVEGALQEGNPFSMDDSRKLWLLEQGRKLAVKKVQIRLCTNKEKSPKINCCA